MEEVGVALTTLCRAAKVLLLPVVLGVVVVESTTQVSFALLSGVLGVPAALDVHATVEDDLWFVARVSPLD